MTTRRNRRDRDRRSPQKFLPDSLSEKTRNHQTFLHSYDWAAGLSKCATILYELVCLFLAVVDIFSDVLITWNFYHEEEARVFFWFSFAILVVAQVSYTSLFATIYFSFDWSRKRTTLAWFLVFPFAQAVPFVIWLESFQFNWFTRFFKYLGLKNTERAMTMADDSDPMFDYLRLTFQTHGGFLLEAVVEAIPQSILQMTYIVLHQKVGYINVFSITLSLISVASKGVLLSYSLDRLTFVFNIFCFSTDLFNIFCTVAFLFFLPPNAPSYSVFFLTTPVDFYSCIWFHLQAVLWLSIILYLVGFLLFLTLSEFRQNGFWNLTRLFDRVMGVLFTGLAALLFVPVMIVLIGIKLSLIPILVFQTTEPRSASHAGLMREIYRFIGQGGFRWGVFRTTDLKVRQAAMTRAIAWCEIRNLTYGSTHDRRLADAIVQVPPEQGYDPLMVFRVEPDPTTPLRLWLEALQETRKNIINQQNYPSNLPLYKYHLLDLMTLAGVAFLAYWVLPVLLLNALYSLCYPVICLYRIPLAEMGYLQTTFMAIYCGVVVVVLVLAPHAIRFAIVSNLPLYNYIHERQLGYARSMYESYLSRPAVYELLCDEVALPQDLAKLVMSYVPPYEMEVMHKEVGAFWSFDEHYCEYVRM